jgi:hypothetical protein
VRQNLEALTPLVEAADGALSRVSATRVLRTCIAPVSRSIEDAIAGFGPREANDPVQAKVYLCMALESLQKIATDPAIPAGSQPALALAELQVAISELISGALSGCYNILVPEPVAPER